MELGFWNFLKGCLTFICLFPVNEGNCFLKNEVVRVSDQFPICCTEVQVKGLNILYDGFYGKIFVVDLDLVSDFIREGEKKNNPCSNIAQNGPDGKKSNAYNSKD